MLLCLWGVTVRNQTVHYTCIHLRLYRKYRMRCPSTFDWSTIVGVWVAMSLCYKEMIDNIRNIKPTCFLIMFIVYISICGIVVTKRDIPILLCKARRQYLLTCKVSRYCLLALYGRIVISLTVEVIQTPFTVNHIYYVSMIHGAAAHWFITIIMIIHPISEGSRKNQTAGLE